MVSPNVFIILETTEHLESQWSALCFFKIVRQDFLSLGPFFSLIRVSYRDNPSQADKVLLGLEMSQVELSSSFQGSSQAKLSLVK